MFWNELTEWWVSIKHLDTLLILVNLNTLYPSSLYLSLLKCNPHNFPFFHIRCVLLSLLITFSKLCCDIVCFHVSFVDSSFRLAFHWLPHFPSLFALYLNLPIIKIPLFYFHVIYNLSIVSYYILTMAFFRHTYSRWIVHQVKYTKVKFYCLDTHMGENILCLFSGPELLQHNFYIPFTFKFHFSLWLSNIPLCRYNTYFSCICMLYCPQLYVHNYPWTLGEIMWYKCSP